MISFSTGKLRKKALFRGMRNLFSFSTAQTEKKSWTKLEKKRLTKSSDEFVKVVLIKSTVSIISEF
jgi:hypothetical protein